MPVVKRNQGRFSPSAAKRFSLKSGAGFTLIETVLYVALFSFVISMAALVFYQLLQSELRSRGHAEIDQEADFLFRKIQWALSGARSINTPLPNGTSSILSVDRFNYGANPVVFSLATGTASMSEGTSSSASLTNDNVFVDTLTFTHIAPTGNKPPGVGLSFSLRGVATQTVVAVSTTIQTTIYLRK